MEIDQLSMNVWVWSRSVDFRIGFSLQVFCILYITLSDFLTMDVLECTVNPTCFIGCWDWNLFNLLLKTIVLIFNTPTKKDDVNIGTAWGAIICDTWNYHELLPKKWMVKRSPSMYLRVVFDNFAARFIFTLRKCLFGCL